MKTLIASLLSLWCGNAFTQGHSLTKLWQTDSVIAVPESVLIDKSTLYVSLINGSSWSVDGKGGIAKLKTNGSIIDSAWVVGLNAPKGLGKWKNKLYVADITEVIVIDIRSGKILQRIKIDSAQALNDVTISTRGIVYVSDSRKGNVYKLENDKPELYLENLKGINGLKSIRDELFIAAGKSFVKADREKNITVIAELPQSGDGVEPVGNGDFIVSAWSGYVFYVHANGKVETLLETFAQKRNTADIGYDSKRRIIYIPTFNAKTVEAYQLK